jgi:hypothetical protein
MGRVYAGRCYLASREPTHMECFLGVFIPLVEAARAPKTAVVGKFDLGFPRSAGSQAALDDLLLSGASGLNHLVHRAVVNDKMDSTG